MTLNPQFLTALLFALLFHGVWGLRVSGETNQTRPGVIGAVLLLLALLIAIAR